MCFIWAILSTFIILTGNMSVTQHFVNISMNPLQLMILAPVHSSEMVECTLVKIRFDPKLINLAFLWSQLKP